MKIPILRIPYDKKDINYIQDKIKNMLNSGQLAMGRNVEEFEKIFSNFIGVKYAVGVNSGTSALEIILRSFDIRGSSVIVPTNTFMATATSVVHAGGKIIFCDASKSDLCIDPDDISEKIQKNTKALILVHIGGIISENFYAIREICEDNNIFLVEDAAHAHGSSLDGKMAGSLGIAGAFSFYPTKVLTCGEGGMITTDDISIYERALVLRDHGKPDHTKNIHTEFGYNWRMSELHGILGLQQMKKAEWILNERRRCASRYDKLLKNFTGCQTLSFSKDMQSSYYKYIVYLSGSVKRDTIKTIMRDKYDVELTGEVYADPCHSQPVFERYPDSLMKNKKSEGYPGADYVCERHICLPLYPGLTDREIEYTVDSLKKAISEGYHGDS